MPAQGLSQQTPSTQLPIVHSRPLPQVKPLAFFVVQVPPVAQKLPAAQSPSFTQAVLHAEPSVVHAKPPAQEWTKD